MVEELHELEGSARSGETGMPQRSVSGWYVAVAVAVFAFSAVLIHQVHRHRTKASDGCLMDGDQRIALNRDTLSGDSELPAEYRTALVETLRTGSLYGSVPTAAAPSSKGTPHGGEAAFRLLAPTNGISVSDQPLLDWEDLDDAEQYKVSVYDAKDHLVEESPLLAASAWRPSVPLDRGQTYHWVVRARLSDREVRVPAEGAPLATFVIAPQAVADKLLLAQAKYADHHLLLATLFARAGDTQAASRELDLADEQDAGHPLLAKLRTSLRQRPAATSAR